ncbi:uncharacterized protein LOC105165116 isoform X2 [Sesamum indicum]|uniref:Uncharacterized protein LOC105165116 isoform X2 n=1 Tax=Sesamum indicum TaxID=4182 RepID=A0A6I9TCJ8_SESIN|nr:uncharacterized protein LOC105165116 isoform X2 [Sesamum indicum]
MGSTSYNDAAQKELEDELVKAGRKLHSLPSSTDEILIRLEKAESVLARVWQLPPSSTEDALYPVMKGLISDKLLRHADENVQLAVASCFNELTRITAPKFPYNDEDMREIFKLFLVALRPLSSETGSNYLRAVQILEGLATVRSCLIMLDIDSDEIVVDMFQLFFNTIRSNPSSNIVNYMETIMRMVIEEIDEVSLDLLRPLLASVRMDNKNISPSSWELGKIVFEGCGTKLQPYLREAVTTLNLNVDDYAPIVASLCQDTSNGETMVAEEVVETVPSVAAGPSGDRVSKLDGVPEAEQEDCTHQEKDENGNILDDENSLVTLNCCQQIVQLKSNDARSDVEVVNNAEISQLEMDMGALPRRRGMRPNTLMKPEEGYEHVWAMGGKDFRKLSYQSNNKEKKDLLVPSEPGKPNIPSDSSQKEFDSVNEGSVRKRRRSKKKEAMPNEHDDEEQLSKQRRKILQTKAKERGPHAPKSRAEKVVARSSTFNIVKGEGNCSGTESEGKDEFLLQELSGKEEIKDEIIIPKRELGDDVEQMVECPMAGPPKAKKPDNLAPETEKNQKSITPSVDYGEELVSLRIMVWWPIDKTFYTGTVEAFDPLTKKHRIKYDDDEEEVLNLKKERWELFSEKQPRKSYQKQEADDHDPSPAEKPVKIQKITKRKPGSSRKQHTPTSSIRPKGEGRGLAKSGGSSSNLESDDKMCEANFSSKDVGENNRAGKKHPDSLDQHKKTKPITPPPEMR